MGASEAPREPFFTPRRRPAEPLGSVRHRQPWKRGGSVSGRDERPGRVAEREERRRLLLPPLHFSTSN